MMVLLITDRRNPITMSLTFVTLLGSLRKGSYNGIVARALPALAPDGVTITTLGSVGALPHYDADVQAEGWPNAVTGMADAIRAADGLIIVSPEYNYSMPGALKNAIDWLSRLPEQPFRNKPVLIHSASPGVLGGARMQYHLRQSLVFLDARVFNVPEVMVSAVHTRVDEAKGELTDQGTRDFIAKHLASFAAFAKPD
jgi:chromate reductase, NAD(P)H dehydrogenase (quinone)